MGLGFNMFLCGGPQSWAATALLLPAGAAGCAGRAASLVVQVEVAAPSRANG